MELWAIILNWLYCLFFSSQNIAAANKAAANKAAANKAAANKAAANKAAANKYEYKYIKKFDLLKNNAILSLNEKSLDYSYIMDNTPCGNIVMKYDREQEVFTYYSDKKDVPYKYLETVARKFVINNDCLELYVDIRDELRKKVYDVAIVDDTSDYGAKDERIKSVFATFKKQNGNAGRMAIDGAGAGRRAIDGAGAGRRAIDGADRSGVGSGAMTRSKTGAKAKTNRKMVGDDKSKNVIFKENINGYKWIGRFCDFSILEKTHMVHANDNTVPEEISFSEFKKKESIRS